MAKKVENNQVAVRAGKDKKEKKKTEPEEEKMPELKRYFSSSRFKSLLKSRFKNKVERSAAVYLAAICGFLTSELITKSSTLAREKKRVTVSPQDINDSLNSDLELKRTFGEDDINIVHAADKYPALANSLSSKNTKKFLIKQKEERLEKKRLEIQGK